MLASSTYLSISCARSFVHFTNVAVILQSVVVGVSSIVMMCVSEMQLTVMMTMMIKMRLGVAASMGFDSQSALC